MHKAQKLTNDPTANVGISENAAACKLNIAKNTARPPILSERAGHRRRPMASDTEMIIMKAAARVAEAPPMEPAITLASERMARPAVVLRKNTAHIAYIFLLLWACLSLHVLLPFWPFDLVDLSSRASSPGAYLTNQAA